MNQVMMERMSRMTYRDRVASDNTVLSLLSGATEQHDPHLPLGTDALLATAVAADVARRLGGLVAPALNYGYKSQPKCGGGQHFPGTTSLDAVSLIHMACDVIRQLAHHGVQRLVVVGHYENQWFLTEAIDLALRDLGPSSPLRVLRLEYWDFLTEQILACVFPNGFPGFALEHAAVIVTSLMLHYYPELVRMDLLPDDGPADFPNYDVYPPIPDWVPASGVLSSVRGTDATNGAAIHHESHF